MSGQTGGRGYLVQALVAVLDALKRDDWALVEIEPNHADEKVDIRWSDGDTIVRVTQVKSSERAIQRADAIRWLSDLINGTPDVDEYELILLGGHSQGVVDLSKASRGVDTKASAKAREKLPPVLDAAFEKIRIPSVRPLDLEALNDIASERLEEFLHLRGLDIPMQESRRLIVAYLVTTFFENSTSGIPLSRADIESRIGDWASNYVTLRTLPPAAPPLRKFVQIAGSAAETTDQEILKYSHQLVRNLTQRLLECGYGLVTKTGKDKVADPSNPQDTRLLFYWDVLETIDAYIRTSPEDNGAITLPLARVVYSSKLETQIPESHRPLWDRLLDRGAIELDFIYPGWNAGAFRRMLEAEHGDALIVLGGGEGVEHLALLYMQKGKPVIPVDLPIPSLNRDGSGGAEQLARYALSKPKQYIGEVSNAAVRLSSTLTRRGKVPGDKVCGNIVDLLEDAIKPRVFYIRLTDPSDPNFEMVEKFFDKVVSPFICQMGYVEASVRSDSNYQDSLNLAMLQSMHYSSVVIADLTGLSDDQLILLGYALGHKHRVIITASNGTILPSGLSLLPCFRWNPKAGSGESSKRFCEFWETNLESPPLIQPPSIP